MSRAPFPAAASCALLLVLMTAGSPVGSAESASPGPQAIPADRSVGSIAAGEAYRRAIRSLESSDGAYAQALTEQLASLGIDLQRRGEHRKAIAAFKRGVHLARINEGLYCPQQIPLLERQIASYLALGEYDAADERERYLYRVQMHSLGAGPERVEALLQQADWQFSAYRLNLQGEDYTRLINMWELYNLAFNDIAAREGQSSARLVDALQGMLQAQYLIADYGTDRVDNGFNTVENFPAPEQPSRFELYRAQSYRKGEAITQALYDVQYSNHGGNSPQTAEAYALRGDWELFHGQVNAAEEAYRAAVGELLPREDAQSQIETLFGQPAELPDNDWVRTIPQAVDPEAGNLLLQFSVSDRGRVGDLERVDDNELNKGTANRIMRALRKMRFRPRLTESGPVDTEVVVRAYEID